MPTTTRTFRVFVSSTFEDLKAERNALAAPGGPFSELTKVCQGFGARFQEIDLRWGVREEAGLDQRTMEICLGEIERCQRTGIKPNFIVLLGDRYGWRPLPARIEAGEFRAVREHISDPEDRARVDHWYELDQNAVPPEYLLKPRTGEFKAIHRWGEMETPMHKALREAARSAGLPVDALIKYEASATHQEILKGLGKTAEDREHVFAFLCKSSEPNEDPDLAKLKQFLRDELKGNVFEPRDAAELCERVLENVERVIRAEAAAFKSRPALDIEVEAHDAFARDCARHFIGREDVLDSIDAYVKGGDRRPMVVHGASGSGKSAVMARALEPLLANPGNTVVIRRFIGATPESSSGITLLRSICEEIGDRYSQAGALPAKFDELIVLFQNGLRLATVDRPLTLYVDALDQLGPGDPAATVSWLPRELPANCRIVLSMIDVPTRLEKAKLVPIEPFSQEEASETLALWLGNAGRTLQDDQRRKLLDNSGQQSLPLYLCLAFGEARRWKSFDPIERCVLGDGLTGIIDRLFGRLSEPGNHGAVLVSHALGFLAAARYGLTEDELLTVLAANDVVWGDFELSRQCDLPPHMVSAAEGDERRLPVIIWSRLYLDLEPYLTERAVRGGTTISFYYRQLAERVSKDKTKHAELARYFSRCSDWEATIGGGAVSGCPSTSEADSTRALSEFPFQLTKACLWKQLELTLTDLMFLAAKSSAGMVYDLLNDCDHAIRAHPDQAVSAVNQALATESTAIFTRPDLALQLIYNRLRFFERLEPIIARSLSIARSRLDEWPFWIGADSPLSGSGSSDSMTFSLSGPAPVQSVSAKRRVMVSASRDGAVEFHDLDSGEVTERRQCSDSRLAAIALREDTNALAFITQSGLVCAEISGASLLGRRGETAIAYHSAFGVFVTRQDGALVCWNPDSHEQTVLADCLPFPLIALQIREDSTQVFFIAGRDQQVFGLASYSAVGWNLKTFAYSGLEAIQFAMDFDTKCVLLATADRCLRILDLHTGEIAAQISYELYTKIIVRGAPAKCVWGEGSLRGMAFVGTRDGHVASWDWRSGTLLRWDDDEGSAIILLAALQSPDGLFYSKLRRGSLGQPKTTEGRLTRHRGRVKSCCVTDSQKIISASDEDHTVRWSAWGLRPMVTRFHRGPSVIARSGKSDDALVGSLEGMVWNQPPEVDVPAIQVFRAFAEPTVSLFYERPGCVIAAGRQGRVLRIHLLEDRVDVLWNEPLSTLHKILPAGQYGSFWVIYRKENDVGKRTLVALVRDGMREDVVYSSRQSFRDADVTPDRNTLCIAFDSVVGLQLGPQGWESTFQRETLVDNIAFLGGNNLLAVTLSKLPWLEVWNIARGLPTVAASDIPAGVSSLSATGDRIIAGFTDGQLVSLRFSGRTNKNEQLGI